MLAEEFKKLLFSQRILIAKGEKCNAEWQVKKIGGDAASHILCRNCGTILMSGCVPRCLINVTVEQAKEEYKKHHNIPFVPNV